MILASTEGLNPSKNTASKVLYLLDTLRVFGGTERQLCELIAHLDRSRFDPIVLTLYSMDMPHSAELGGMGCPTRCLQLPRLLSFRGLRAVFNFALAIRRQKVDIVHTFFPDASIVGIIAGRLAGARVIVARRDLGYWYTRRYLLFLRILQHFAHAYLVNSQAVRQVVCESERVDCSRLHVVYNGFFTQSKGTPKIALESLGVPAGAKVVGTVANLRQVKRLDRFIEMAAGIRDPLAYFLIVGFGELHDALVDQARALGLGDRFRIVHSIHSVHDIIAQFRVGVLTSESEGLSNSLVEYGLAGVPAVAFDVGGNSEVIEDGASGFLVRPYEVSEMRRQVERLLADDCLRSRLGAHAKSDYTSRFAGPRMVAKTVELYERVRGRVI
jgi:L-malate glycosyltransferase